MIGRGGADVGTDLLSNLSLVWALGLNLLGFGVFSKLGLNFDPEGFPFVLELSFLLVFPRILFLVLP